MHGLMTEGQVQACPLLYSIDFAPLILSSEYVKFFRGIVNLAMLIK